MLDTLDAGQSYVTVTTDFTESTVSISKVLSGKIFKLIGLWIACLIKSESEQESPTTSDPYICQAQETTNHVNCPLRSQRGLNSKIHTILMFPLHKNISLWTMGL